MIFDSDGNLMLPRGTARENRLIRRKLKPKATGVFVICQKCGNTWERKSEAAGTVRCHSCNDKIQVEEIF
jgi:ribosomal protein S27E